MTIDDVVGADLLEQIDRNITKNTNRGLLLEVLRTQEILRQAQAEEEVPWEGESLLTIGARLESQIKAYHRHCDVNEIESLLPRKD